VSFAGIVVVVLALVAPSAHAETPWYEQISDAAFESLFAMAWPTATYDHTAFQDSTAQPGGADFRWRIFGRTKLEGEIWIDVILELRDNKLKSLHFGRHALTLVPPGATVRATMEALQATFNPSSWGALCVRNISDRAILYDIRWGRSKETRKLEPGTTWRYWVPGEAQVFEVTFDTSFEEGYTGRTFRVLSATLRAKPDVCDDSFTYQFMVSGQFIGFGPTNWTPGSEHPFWPHVVAGQRVKQWSCARGYQWMYPDDSSDLRCISGWP
jgi:hypothetical protein